MLTITDPVTLWFESGAPSRMIWRGQRLRVTDSPTALTRAADDIPPLITHPPVVKVGWRFQAADDAGVNRVFDVRRDGSGWMLEHVYD